MRLTGRIQPISDLTSGQRDAMFALLTRHYEHANRDSFEMDIKEKHWVILAEHPDDRSIYGFSTQMLIEHPTDEVSYLFSGDTIIDPRFWARNPLVGLWGRLVLSLIDANPHRRLYWFLISKGYKTYRLLPVFFHEFYPRRDQATPEWAAKLIRDIATKKFSNAFDHDKGVILPSADSCRLRTEVAPITSARLADPDIQFFCQANPDHHLGAELCCLAPLTRANFRPHAYWVMGIRSHRHVSYPIEHETQ